MQHMLYKGEAPLILRVWSLAIQSVLKQPDVVSKLASLGLLAAQESASDMTKRLAAGKLRYEIVIKSSVFQTD
jgi:hypothetical protein